MHQKQKITIDCFIFRIVPKLRDRKCKRSPNISNKRNGSDCSEKQNYRKEMKKTWSVALRLMKENTVSIEKKLNREKNCEKKFQYNARLETVMEMQRAKAEKTGPRLLLRPAQIKNEDVSSYKNRIWDQRTGAPIYQIVCEISQERLPNYLIVF